MICVLQRASAATLTVNHQPHASCDGPTLVVLAALEPADTDADLLWIADKLVNIRIFRDDADKMNLSVLDTSANLLLVSNFTLAADASRGRRPSFDSAMPPHLAEPMFARFVDIVRARCPRVSTGVFAAHMHLTFTNDGPVTLILNSSARPK